MLARRTLLQHLFIWPVALAAPRLGALAGSSGNQDRVRLAQAYRRIGQAYATQFPQAVIAADNPSLASLQAGAADAAIRRDFEDGRVVILSGWVLSQTECDICLQAWRAGETG
jgi:hypothetical protein